MAKIKALVAKLEKTKQAEQAFRAVRLAGTALVAYAVAHLAAGTGLAGTSVTIGGAVVVVEGAFHQVFSSK